MDAVDDMVSRLTRIQPDEYVEEIRRLVFTPDALERARCAEEQFTRQGVCEYVPITASRRGILNIATCSTSWGHRLDQAFGWSVECVVYGSVQPRYGPEMLYLQWLLSDSVSDPELQHAILGSGLVNIAGRGNTFKAIDVALEHVNAMYHVDMKMRKNSIHDIDKDVPEGRASQFLHHRVACSGRGCVRRACKQRTYWEGCKTGCVRSCYVASGCWLCMA